MLCQFTFKNFKSYRDETTFDFQAANLPEFKDSLIYSNRASDVLPVSVVYGPNGGGKSNLLKALGCAVGLVVRPVYELGKTRTEFIMLQNIAADPFQLDDTSSSKPTEFQIFFRTGKDEFRFYISVLHNVVKAESLYRKNIGGTRTALVYERKEDAIELGTTLKKEKVNTNINSKIPFLSFLAINYDIPVIEEAEGFFESCIVRSYADPQAETEVLLDKDRKKHDEFIHAINSMGIHIFDYEYDESQKEFYLLRNIHDKTYPLAFSDESDGTKKIFSSLSVILLALREGRPVIIDELDAKLHPKLLRYIIRMFTDKNINKNGAQLLFTSQDMSTLKNTVFRRDEIWFAAEDDDFTSQIYSLNSIRDEDDSKIRNTASYSRQYLEGRYGADPYLTGMLDWEK